MATQRLKPKTRINSGDGMLERLQGELSEIRSHQALLHQKLEQALPSRNELLEALSLMRGDLMRIESDMLGRLKDLRASLEDGKVQRKNPQYANLLQRIRSVVQTSVPTAATLAVVSRGDDALLDVFRGSAWHFPQGADGEYLGYHPASSDQAVVHLESLRARGANYFLLPATSFWWLEYYAGFRSHLELNFQLLHDDEACRIYHLDAAAPWVEVADFVAAFRRTHGRFPAILSWQVPADLKSSLANCAVFAPIDPACDELPYLDDSVDVVAVDGAMPNRFAEAQRVAVAAVVSIARAPLESGDFQVAVAPKL